MNMYLCHVRVLVHVDDTITCIYTYVFKYTIATKCKYILLPQLICKCSYVNAYTIATTYM